MPLLNCKCCGVKAEPNSDFCWICLGRGHDEEMSHEQGNDLVAVDFGYPDKPVESAQPAKKPIDKDSLDKILVSIGLKGYTLDWDETKAALLARQDRIVAEVIGSHIAGNRGINQHIDKQRDHYKKLRGGE
jgi:hypothetical protein